jgi:hypothetical protein
MASIQWYFCIATGVETAERADPGERRGQLGQVGSRGARAHVLVVVEHRQPLMSFTGTTDFAKWPPEDQAAAARSWEQASTSSGCSRTGWRAGRRPRPGDEVVVVGGGRVVGHGAAVGAHRHPRHRLHSPGDHQFVEAGTHGLGGDVDRLQTRAAEPVELHPADGVGQAGGGRGGAGNVLALVADRGDDPQHQVVDAVLVEIGESGA